MKEKEIKENWEKEFDETKFAKGGGCCFECCDYEGMYLDLKDFIHQLLKSEKQKLGEEIMKIVEDVLFEKYLEYDDTQRAIKELKNRAKIK